MRTKKLLNASQTAEILGLKTTNRDWKNVRRILMQQYGMKRLPGVGLKIPEENLEKFLSEQYV